MNKNKSPEQQTIILMVLDHFFKGGLGAVMILMGTVLVALHDKLDLQYPVYLIVGLVLISLGLIAYLFQTGLHHQRKMLLIKNNIAIENQKKSTTRK